MKLRIVLAVCAVVTTSCAMAQTPAAQSGPNNNAVNSSGQNNSNAPVAGRNSFNEGQAESRIGLMRIGVAGAGLIGRKHVEQIEASPDCAVAGIADPSADAKAFAEAHSISWYTDYRAPARSAAYSTKECTPSPLAWRQTFYTLPRTSQAVSKHSAA
jgi:hypothetical protein